MRRLKDKLKIKTRGISKKIVMRYVIIQLIETIVPIIVLLWIRRWFDIAGWVVWVIIILWLAKDMALFPLVWRAYDWEGSEKKDSMIGKQGTAKERLDPTGYIRIRGELWQAKIFPGTRPIEIGDAVRVVKKQGLTLFVEADK